MKKRQLKKLIKFDKESSTIIINIDDKNLNLKLSNCNVYNYIAENVTADGFIRNLNQKAKHQIENNWQESDKQIYNSNQKAKKGIDNSWQESESDISNYSQKSMGRK